MPVPATTLNQLLDEMEVSPAFPDMALIHTFKTKGRPSNRSIRTR